MEKDIINFCEAVGLVELDAAGYIIQGYTLEEVRDSLVEGNPHAAKEMLEIYDKMFGGRN